ncbi:MAG: mannose-1-phosphate guanylyltransferase/mannose-6-phosphate isomerase [Flavobacteriaceae bacterium]|nr:mannose-1-phosphate guanylyltransferase/mannose-6-phosphate isomerase [Flavobacteriaceae bacterium]
MINAVILAGGSGTRLWPLSRAAQPKQFLVLTEEETMLQSTVKRLDGLNLQSSVTICNEDHRFFVAEQLREINKLDSIILEPVSRNTAPAVALAALSLKEVEDCLILVVAADHVIKDKLAFTNTVKNSIPLAEAGKLVTFGIVAHEPNTGYGYIKKGEPLSHGFAVDAFVEKPPVEVAKQYLKSGNYLWNSGMFLFKASRYLEELKRFRPDIYNACESSMKDVAKDNEFIRINKEAFHACPHDSIDFAVMERTTDAVVIPMDAGWSDIGSWSSLWEISQKDGDGNATYGDVILHESNNSYIRTDGRLVAAVGVDDLVVVSTKDVVLVAHKTSVNNVKKIAEKIKNDLRTEWENHREVCRPWGKFDSVDKGEGYQVKRITVNAGAKLSVQKHHHRAEHWVVVRGVAKVTNGEKTFLLSENESTYIPLGSIHSLENPGKTPLEMIEVQSGSYLGEDDIVRYEDIYGRVPE